MSARRKLEQKGHITTEKQVELEQAKQMIMSGQSDLVKPPTWLNHKYAKDEWKRIVPTLIDMDMICNLDFQALCGYCNAFANYRLATEELAKSTLVITNVDNATGFTYSKENPLVGVQIKAGTEMRRFADLCGITINSRLKAAVTKQEKQKDTIKDDFGDI